MKRTNRITIIDYGMGNLRSVQQAFAYLGEHCLISSKSRDIESSDAIILPGVGSFALGMQNLRTMRLNQAILEHTIVKKRKILGICLGFQMLAESSTEAGFNDGLGLISGKVERFGSTLNFDEKIPHIGFNQVNMPDQSPFFSGFNGSAEFYFVHSYRILPTQVNGSKAVCTYGENFLAAYQHENIFGTQFHPEKSQTTGLRLLNNFLRC